MKRHLYELVVTLMVWMALTIVLVAAYGLVQQAYRNGANDPQLELAQATAAALTQNLPPETLIKDSEVDLRQSLATATIIYDDQGEVVTADAKLNDAVPTIPAGVLEYAKLHGRNVLTWEPANGVRLAAVVVRSGGDSPGYVLVARSLHEVEKRESQAFTLTVAAWLAATLTLWLGFMGLTLVKRSR